MDCKEKKNINTKLIIKIVLLVAMVCFFMPFVLVSCSNQSVTASGVELASGIFSDKYIQEEDIAPNIFVAISLLSTLAAVIFAFVKKGEKKTLIEILSVISAVGLLMFMLTFKAYYQFDERDEQLLQVSFRIPVWIIIILNIITAALEKGIDNYVESYLSGEGIPINIKEKLKPKNDIPIPSEVKPEVEPEVEPEPKIDPVIHSDITGKLASSQSGRLKTTFKSGSETSIGVSESSDDQQDESERFTPAGDL